MSEQIQKRGPGRPRKDVRRQHVDITLSQEVLDYLDRQTQSRSQFIEQVLRERMTQEKEQGR